MLRTTSVHRAGAVAVLVTTLAAGLGAVRPAAATGGDAPAAGSGLARYHQQRVVWTGCQQSPEDESGRDLDRAGARCARVTVPLDYADPDGRTIQVAISRLAATDTRNRIGAMLLNDGGPGATGIGMPLDVREPLGDVGRRYDLIGMDPRFIGRSTPLDCGWPTGTSIRSAGLDRAGFDRMAAFVRDLAARCARTEADVLPYATTRNTARDMDVIRAVLGERRISYLGYSYGTYLGAVYTQMFPHRPDRVVFDSPVDPRRYGPEMLADTAAASEAALHAWAAWAAGHHGEYGLGATRREVLGSVDRITLAAARRPLRVGGYRVDEHLVPLLVVIGLADDRAGPRADLAANLRVLEAAAEGAPADPPPTLAEALEFITTGSESAYGSAQSAIICGDRAAPRSLDHYWRRIEAVRRHQPRTGPVAAHIGPCAFWAQPPREQPTRVHNDVPALIVAATGDPRTIYRNGLVLRRLMTGSRLLTLRGARVHGVYGSYRNACVDTAVNAYLAGGVLPADLTCAKSQRGGR
jgi:pimeloyl-ACP methyl ester carboxylesterase